MAAGFRQRQVCPGLVAVTASVVLSDRADPGQVGDGAVGAALGDAPAGRDVAQAHLRVRATHSALAWLVRKVQFAIINMLLNSGKILLVTGCKRSVQDRHRNSAANDGSLPGATAGAHTRRPGHRHRRGYGARSAAHPAEAAGAHCKPPGQIPGLAAADAEPVTR